MLISLFAAVAASSAPQAVTPPAWRTHPTASEFSAAYPANAAHNHLGGEAEITCAVNVHGLLEACKVASESPPGEGFGAAALLLAPRFSMTPASGLEGPRPAIINIPIRFQVPPEPTRTHAEWVRKPNSGDVVWPGIAWYGHISGHAVLDCVISDNGALKPCVIVEDTPEGRGFAQATIGFLGPLKMRPPTVDGAPVQEAHVQITMDFDGGQRGVRFMWRSQ